MLLVEGIWEQLLGMLYKPSPKGGIRTNTVDIGNPGELPRPLQEHTLRQRMHF